jgi:hypothetical protein
MSEEGTLNYSAERLLRDMAEGFREFPGFALRGEE